MISFNEWHIIHEAIDRKTCKKIIALGKKDFAPGMADSYQENKEDTKRISEFNIVKDTRVSDVHWITNNKWVNNLVVPALTSANEKAGWNYDITSVEALQLTRYRKGGFYSWHNDGQQCHLAAHAYGDKDPNKYVRKLSMTILLNSNYSGGEFQFCSYRQQEQIITTPETGGTGSIVIFPSYMEHRVAPVTKGIRYSLVAWFLGPPFK